MINILMIEDNLEFAELLGSFLSQYNIKITNFEDPYLGLSCGIKSYDLIILDLTLPGLDGLEVCTKIRKDYDIPIIISSARSDISDKLIGFENGADDYLPKPYDPKEMYARIISLLKRYKKIVNIEQKTESKSDFKLEENEISFRNDILNLTKAEYEILKVLINAFNYTVSREQIVDECESLNDEYGKTLSTLIGRIKQKTSSDSIVTVRGIGYKLVK